MTSPPFTVELHREQFTVVADRADTQKFWSLASTGKWEDDTLSFVDRHVTPASTFVDIGAWIGPISLYASRFGSRVISIEPDPVAHADLERNVRLNDRGGPIDIWHVGVDQQRGKLVLFAPGGLGQSVTSALAAAGGQEISVPTVSFDDITARLGQPQHTVVKVDIEGHEYKVADQLVAFVERHRAPLHLSLHPRAYFENSASRRLVHRCQARHLDSNL